MNSGTLPAGTRLRNYELISVLGHGGFGITYYARDTTLGREVAVKEYLPTSLALRENGTMVVPRSTQLAEDFIWGRERFLEEARILATLEGVPSIVRVYDFLEANGTAYMVMALARGETLEQRLKRDKQLPAAIVERLFDRLLGGLEEVHKAGFLHRDVKPANIILDAKDNPTLIDFGASRAAMADRTAALTAIFTPRYAAAEQLTSDKQGPWTDIYSVSATLYHAITGEPPPSSLERALNDSYEPLTGLSLTGFSAGTLQGIDAGMALRAKHRPQSIAIWRDILSSTESPQGDATVFAARAKTQPGGGDAGPSCATAGACRTAAPRRACPAGWNRAVFHAQGRRCRQDPHPALRRNGRGDPRPGRRRLSGVRTGAGAGAAARAGSRSEGRQRRCGGGRAAARGGGSGLAKGDGRGPGQGRCRGQSQGGC